MTDEDSANEGRHTGTGQGAAAYTPLIRFGGTDASVALRNARTNSAINKLAEAEFELDSQTLPELPVDFVAQVQIAVRREDEEHLLFTGDVVSVDVNGTTLEGRATSGVTLTEGIVAALAAHDVPHVELMYVMTRIAGFRDENIRIDGLDALPREVFEVMVPLQGIRVTSRRPIGDAWLVPSAQGHSMLSQFDDTDETRRFADADAYALALVTANRMLDAERAGLHKIDIAVSWLTVRSRYGLAVLPTGEPKRYQRSEARAVPQRVDQVVVRGLASGRRWLRVPRLMSDPKTLVLETPLGERRHEIRLDLPDDLVTAEEQALLALARAATDTELLARTLALWQSIEFYVGAGAQGDIRLFTKPQLRKLRRRVKKVLTDESDIPAELHERLLTILCSANDPPLMAKLRQLLVKESVTLSDEEWELLGRLRTARNDAVHGKKIADVLSEDVDRAVSIAARMLVFHFDRRLSNMATAVDSFGVAE